MSVELRTIQATVETNGTVVLAEPIKLKNPATAVVTILIDDEASTGQADRLEHLMETGSRTESLVRRLYRRLDAASAAESIAEIEQLQAARHFFTKSIKVPEMFASDQMKERFWKTPRKGKWYDYYGQVIGAMLQTDKQKGSVELRWAEDDRRMFLVVDGTDPHSHYSRDSRKLAAQFDLFKNLKDDQLREALIDLEL